MKYRAVLFVLVNLLGSSLRANMSPPYLEGSHVATPFVNSYVDIIRENLKITPDSKFETAFYEIEYQIFAQQSGQQIPLLFYALDYVGDFKVWIDNKPVEILQVPDSLINLKSTLFYNFNYAFKKYEDNGQPEAVIMENEHSGRGVKISDLKYFEIDLDAGKHSIRVEYVAKRWETYDDWVVINTFRYALSPAENWKSFNELNLHLDATNFAKDIYANLRKPDRGELNSEAYWVFNNLPVRTLEISFKPKVSLLANILIFIHPLGIMIKALILLVLLHILTLKQHRKFIPELKRSWITPFAAFVVPILLFIVFVQSFDLIDYVIGENASGYHGYTFLIVIFYPIMVPFYWIMMRVVERRILSDK